MPDESFKFLMVWCLAKPLDFQKGSQVSRVFTGSCSMSDILTNQDGWAPVFQMNEHLETCILLVGYG